MKKKIVLALGGNALGEGLAVRHHHLMTMSNQIHNRFRRRFHRLHLLQ